ncbi:3-dehydroquinate synthase [Aliidiomarina haloalkalitolerans]|uniref:3-dehydroquinate synthase n=1 Tax=Aliidiomarina haloalkalitolerans TaxID=859059 RepID=A0A432VRE2_9GAMM|nr:3-dehydroquinate synthase [Aliidiomarina haloalkalitolerans]RUO18855.1 3-dehydroquinate synthase [Aliidiomarina haloalkalitolerans]
MSHGEQRIFVELGSRRYPIAIGAKTLHQLGALLAETFANTNRRVFIISNPTVAQHYLATAQASIVAAGFNHQAADVALMDDGEQFKSLASFSAIVDHLTSQQVSRDCIIVALGGGVVGDLAGFVAATWQRGVPFVQVPTTLLAQVDSSVGGKTAINHPGGKNLVGAFHQPSAVLIDIATLATLPDREFLAGLAEVIKYGIMADGEFFDWLESNLDAILARDSAALIYAIRRSCEIKADVVAADETEQGVRALLNLGHTFGHAIESYTKYQSWLHGEAVAAGMLMASRLAAQTGHLAVTDCQRIEKLLQKSGLPLTPPASMTADDWIALMSRDKKVKAGKIRFILPTAIGAAVIVDDITQQQLVAIL